MKKLLFFLFFLLMATSTALADSYFYIEPFSVEYSQIGTRIKIPFMAHFEGRVDSWQVKIELPEGLTYKAKKAGADMKGIPYMDQFEENVTLDALLNLHTETDGNGVVVTGVTSTSQVGYWYNNGVFEPYGSVKWDAGDYYEMFVLTLEVEGELFNESGVDDITLKTTTYSGSDARGGTVADIGEAGQEYTTTAVVEHMIEGPCPGIYFELQDEGVMIHVDYDGILYYMIYINGEEVEESSIDWGTPFEYFVPSEYDEEKIIEICAFSDYPGYYSPSVQVCESCVLPAKERPTTPAPEITFTYENNGVLIDIAGEGVLTGQIIINGEVAADFSRNDLVEYYFEQIYDYEQEIVVTAQARIPDWLPSDEVSSVFMLPAMERPLTPTPVISWDVSDYAVTIQVNGEGDLSLYIDYELVAEGSDPLCFIVPRGEEYRAIEVMALAQLPDYIISEPAIYTIEIPPHDPYPSYPHPRIEYEITDNELIITGHCSDDTHSGYYLTLYVDGVEVATGYDPLVYTIPRGDVDVTVEVELMAIIFVPETDNVTILIPARVRVYDFEEDGIYYKITGDGKVSVTYESTAYNSYSGNVVIPATVTHDGVTYKVTSINDGAFMSCTGLTSVTIGSNVTIIGESAFEGCTGLTSVVLGDYVISVGGRAFYGCTSLTKVTIGSGLRAFGSQAFAECMALTSVFCKPALPPVMTSAACFECYSTATLTVHPAVIDSYRADLIWGQFGTIVESEAVNPAPGDANGDGSVSIADITALIDMLLANP